MGGHRAGIRAAAAAPGNALTRARWSPASEFFLRKRRQSRLRHSGSSGKQAAAAPPSSYSGLYKQEEKHGGVPQHNGHPITVVPQPSAVHLRRTAFASIVPLIYYDIEGG